MGRVYFKTYTLIAYFESGKSGQEVQSVLFYHQPVYIAIIQSENINTGFKCADTYCVFSGQ